ncbi:MAG: lipid A biosynthesis protein [Candidatus Abyssobacteria bacterium SURF_5]|uniref:Lipid A biosynthesis protein n=1 Tax=Abyssobacteria bacterium (strain SURF_5) TaxID=2093360 RepID=A0A3A4NPT9_ABYX5|nr:MAG: lipid A biosynthesis protein [Candidatus Abyssubacteria bacterium SURF_5]
MLEQWMRLGLADRIWMSAGFLGQTVFFMRFLVQWIASERRHESVIPIAFWFLSLSGSAILFTYAIHIRDPVFIVGQASGFLIYIRNLMLIYRKRHSEFAES